MPIITGNGTIDSSGNYTLLPNLGILGTSNVTVEGVGTEANISYGPISALSSFTLNVSTGATANITNGLNISALASYTYNADGGTISAGSGTLAALATATYNITNHGVVEFNGSSDITAIAHGDVYFGTGGGTFVVNPDASLNLLTGLTIHNFDPSSDVIQISGATAITGYDYHPLLGTTTVIFDNGMSINLEGHYDNLTGVVIDGDFTIGACFLRGSLIRTEDGEIAVEDLTVGTKVLAFVDGAFQPRSVTWVGTRTIVVRSADDYPVRVLKGAIAENIPARDLLVTPEHCFFFDGKLVPARMLVNNRSIIADTSFATYDIFHFELEQHSIIEAEGMMAETLLDTGNRKDFTPVNGPVVCLGSFGAAKSWERDAAAPLAVARKVVEPIYRAIEARALAEGFACVAERGELTTDSELQVLTDSGLRLSPERVVNGYQMFTLPPGSGSVHILSRASRPSETVGPFLDDRRFLGVRIGEIMMWEDGQQIAIDTHLTQDLAGWDVRETIPTRWTNGFAALPLLRRPNKVGVLGLKVEAAGPYRVQDLAPVTPAAEKAA